MDAEYADNEPPIAVPMRGCEVVRSESSGSGCAPDVCGDLFCCAGDDTKSDNHSTLR